MVRLFTLLLCCVMLARCGSARYYIVRHAEKESSVVTVDVPLSAKGLAHAQALKNVLARKNITQIYTTNFVRTIATAQPLHDATGLPITTYASVDSTFLKQLKKIENANVLIVGHSNTVDDLVNGLTGKQLLRDLPDTAYGDLILITKKGARYRFSTSRYW